MVKKFHLTVPSKKKKSIISTKVNPDKVTINNEKTINIKYKPKPSENPPYKDTVPNTQMWAELEARYGGNPPIEHWQYVEHRQMDVGRAIALGRHERRKFSKQTETSYLFVEYAPIRIDNPKYDPNWKELPWGQRGEARNQRIESYEIKQYTVQWDGQLPLPSPDASSSSFIGIDCWIWATYFLNNEIPPDDKWFPTPEKYPEWNSLNIGQPVPDYSM